MSRILNEQFLEGTVVVASSQTNGKGQRGNKWVSQPYKSLTFSVLLKPSFLSPIHAFDLSICVALALSDSLNKLRSGLKIKWPNDLLFNKRKFCGILQEIISFDEFNFLIVGIIISDNSFFILIDNLLNTLLLLNKVSDKFDVLVSIEKIIVFFL